MPLSIVSTEPESSSANQLSVVSSKPVQKVTPADIEKVAKEYGVPADLAVGVAHIESAYDPLAKSNKGAQGIMQLMPDTAKRYGVTDSYDPEQNIRGGVQYLRDLLKQFNGDRDKALAAYNWGEKHVADGKEVPSSVQKYVKDVSGKAKEHAWANLKVVSTEPDTKQQKPLSIVSTEPEHAQSLPGQEKPSTPKVGDTGATISQQPKSGWLDRMRQAIANTAIGHSLQSEFPHAAEKLGLTPSETVQSPTYESHKEQFVAPEYLVSPQSHGHGANVIRGALQATGEFTSAPSLSAMVALAATAGLGEAAAPALGRMVSAGFTAKAAVDMVQQVPQLIDLYHEDPQAFEEELGKLSVNASNAILMGAHAAGKEIPVPGIKPEFRRVEEAQRREELWQKAPKIIGSPQEPVHAETPETIGKQIGALKAGTVSTVMIPQGGKVPAVPESMQSVTVDKGKGAGTYIFDPKKISAETIRQAAESGKHGELLGHVQSKAELADKPKVVVQARAKDGTPVQESVVENKPEVVAAQTKVLEDRHPDSEVTVTTPQEVLGERAGVPVEQREAAGEGKEPVKAEKRTTEPENAVYYHGTNNTEAIRKGGFSATGEGSPYLGDNYADGVYLAKSQEPFSEGGQLEGVSDVLPTKVSAKNIKRVDGTEGVQGLQKQYGISAMDPEAPQKLTAALKNDGFDGLDIGDELVVFDPKNVQLKSEAPVEPASGMVRLYRGEYSGQPKPVADWIAESDKFKKTVDASGRWFTTDPSEAQHYADEASQGHVVYVDVPEADLEKYRPQGEAARYVHSTKQGTEHDEYFLPRDIAAKAEARSLQPRTEPASIIKVPIGSLVLDPNRFQYKLNVDEKGVSNILKGRKWNPDLAGVVSVWQDPRDEELYVVNGHHRVDLARENGVQNLDVRVINADNAKEARSIGALQNIAEGRGTAVDAAKFFRDTGRGEKDLENEGITLSESKAADGVALAKLSQPIFDEVAQGRMRVGRGVAIGNATDDPAQQEAILKMIEKREKSGKAIPDSVVAELGRMAKGAKDKTETQDTLFGVQSMTRNLLLEKAEVSDYIRKQIGSEKKLFTTVGTESTAQRLGKAGNVIDAGENAKIAQQAAQAQELYDRFSVKTGEINDILNRAADELSNGESPNAVKQRAYEETRAALSQTLGQGVENRGEGVQAGPRTGEAEAHAEPAAGKREGAVKGPLTEVKLRAELAKHPNITPEQRDAMVTVWKQFAEKYLGMDFDQFLNRYWKDLKVGGEYAGEEGLQQRGAVTWAYHPQKGLLTDRAGRKGHEQLLHEAGVDYMGGRAYDRLPRGRALVDPYTKSVVVTLQGEGDLTPAAERELRHALDVPGDYTVRTNHGALFQQESAPVWYSKLERTVSDAPIKSSASGEQWMRMLQNKGVKASEIEATGLDEFLKGKNKVSRDEVSDFVKANQVEVKEVMKGGDDNVWREEGEPETTKFHTYVTPGGENYRELLLTLPPTESGRPEPLKALPEGYSTSVDYSQPENQKYHVLPPDQAHARPYAGRHGTPEAARAEALEKLNRERVYEWKGQQEKQQFKGGHFDEPNVLAHVRFDDRTDADGNKVLFIQELQSDWHQKGRKQGYHKPRPTFDEWRKTLEAKTGIPIEDTPEERHIYESDTGYQAMREGGVPDAPFKKDWHELALRRMLRYAAENGYDKVAWTTGDMQAERYDLSKAINNISWIGNQVEIYPNGGDRLSFDIKDGKVFNPNGPATSLGVGGKPLDEVVGKEIAEKILAEKQGNLSGAGLRVGGSGMKGFYDKILLDYLNKYGKKFGTQVRETKIKTVDDAVSDSGIPRKREWILDSMENLRPQLDDAETAKEALKEINAYVSKGRDLVMEDAKRMTPEELADYAVGHKAESVHSLDITPELHKAVMEGQPLFQGKAGDVKGATQFMADGKAIVNLYNSADFSTFAHESFHVMRPHLKPEDTAILEREFGVKDGKWTTAHEETAARSWERYLRDGEAPTKALADVFAKIKAWMVGIYQHLAGTELDKNVSPAVREVFDRMLGKEDSVSAETGEQPRPVDPNQEVMFQRRKRAETEPSGLLPGMEEVPEERKQAAAEAEGETLTGELTQPKGDISRAAGEMEQKSPLFRGTEASPQNEMFGDEGQTKLFSGIPPPEEFVKQFRTVFPSVAKRFDDWVSGEPTIGGEQKATMRQTRGEMDRSLSVVAEKLKSYKKEWVPRPREDFRKFAQAVEGLIPVDQLSPRDQELANIFKSGFDEIRSQIMALKPEVLQSYIEHYFPHIWERPGVAEKAVRNVLASKRPFAGSERFRQKRTVPTIEDGLDLGLKPVSWNPVDMFLLKYKEEAQFLMAHKTLDMMKDNGNAKFVRINQASPEGWVKLDDRIGTVYGKEQVQTVEPGQDELYDEGGKPRSFTVIRGHYWAPPEAAKVFNNFVSRGFAGRYTTYDIAQGLNSNLNALQLGISAFHVTTTSVNAATSDIALGLQQLREGKIVEGATRIGSGVATLPSVANTLRNGSKLMKEYLTPGSYEKFSREANAVEQAGGRAKQQTIQLHALDNFMNAIKNRAYGDAAKAAPSAIIEASVWPVMEYYVPRMKFGVFYNMAHDILERADRENWPEERTRARTQKAWDSVDNRFGQMVYDNLFWKKSVRDSLQLATRSVGWNFGTIRELGGAVPDLIKETARVSKGEAPEISDRVAFAFALAGYTAMVGATMTYLMTGKRPQTWKDYYYPRQADGTRMSIPGYMKDVVAYMHDPKQTVMNKMGPLIELTAEAIQNRDFYGTEIRHKDDPAIRQLWQFAKFVGNTAMPFSISGSKKLVQKAGGDTSSFKETVKSGLRHPGQIMAGQFGFQPAPAFIQHSPALNKAYEYEFENRPPGIRTQAQADHHQYMRQMEDMYRSGKVDQKTIDSLLANNQITHADVRKAKVVSRLDPLAWAAFSLTLEQALNVYKDADEREKKILKPIIIKKRAQISKEPDPDKRAELMRSYLQTVHPQGK